jgi:hypothetical protein
MTEKIVDDINMTNISMSTSWTKIIDSISKTKSVNIVNIVNESDNESTVSEIEEDDDILKEQFMEIVNKMKFNDCKLPEEFELFYTIEQIKIKNELSLKITPALTNSKTKTTNNIMMYETIYKL